MIRFSVYDYDNFSNNDFIGTTTVPVKEFMNPGISAQPAVLESSDRSQVASVGVPSSSANFATALEGSRKTSSWNLKLQLGKEVPPEVDIATLQFKASFTPFAELRRAFWSTLAKQYDFDDNGRVNMIELSTMLDSIGSSLSDATIHLMFQCLKKDPAADDLSIPELVSILEAIAHTPAHQRTSSGYASSASGYTSSPASSVPGSPSIPAVDSPNTSMPSIAIHGPSSGDGEEQESWDVTLERSFDPQQGSRRRSKHRVAHHRQDVSTDDEAPSVFGQRSTGGSVATVATGPSGVPSEQAENRHDSGDSITEEDASRDISLHSSQPSVNHDQLQNQQPAPPPGTADTIATQNLLQQSPAVVGPASMVSGSSAKGVDYIASGQEKLAEALAPLLAQVGGGVEKLIQVAQCPICKKPSLRGKSDMEILTHIAVCASEDPGLVENFVMGGFLTEAYAQRKWFTKIIGYVGYGSYSVGKNNANILVQHRQVSSGASTTRLILSRLDN